MSLPTCASLSLISVGRPPPPPSLGKPLIGTLGSGWSTKEVVGETRDVVESPEFSSRFVSALQQTEKEAVKLLTHYFLLHFQTKLLADGVHCDSFSSMLILYSKMMHTFSTYQSASSI